MAHFLQNFQRNHLRWLKWPDLSAAQRTDMAFRAQCTGHVARQSPDIGAFSAAGFKRRMISVGAAGQRQLINLDIAWRKLYMFPGPGQIIGALTIYFQSAEGGRQL